MSIRRLIAPVDGLIRSISPWLGSTAYRSPPTATMLYQVPSGSKSPGFGCPTGWDFRNRLRSATGVVVPSGLTRRIELSVPSRPCEQPAPASSAYNRPPTNATSATPLTSEPAVGEVWLDGRLPATVVRTPFGPIFEMRDVKPPLYGPTGAGTWLQSADVVIWLPPRPPSATYRSPLGPNASPRGLFKPDANTVTFADNAGGVCACAKAEAGTRQIAVTATAAVKQTGHFRILLPSRTRKGRSCLVV